jgi:anti-sigma B factor antagonist
MSVDLRYAPMSLYFDAPPLTLRVVRHTPVAIVAAEGELDTDTTDHLVNQMSELARSGASRLVLDLSCITFCGAAGIRALLTVRETVAAENRVLILRDPSLLVREVLIITGVVGLFSIEATVR